MLPDTAAVSEGRNMKQGAELDGTGWDRQPKCGSSWACGWAPPTEEQRLSSLPDLFPLVLPCPEMEVWWVHKVAHDDAGCRWHRVYYVCWGWAVQPGVLQDNKQMTHIFASFCLDVKVAPCPGKKDVPWICQQSGDVHERDSWVKTRTLGWTQCGCFPLLLGQGWLQTAVSLLCGKREVLAASSLGRCRVSPAQSSLVLFRTFRKNFNSSEPWNCKKISFTFLRHYQFEQNIFGGVTSRTWLQLLVYFLWKKIYKTLLSPSIVHLRVLLFFWDQKQRSWSAKRK